MEENASTPAFAQLRRGKTARELQLPFGDFVAWNPLGN
jgi:hypothetical protein